MRNELAVAIAGLQALAEGRLQPTVESVREPLASLEGLDAALSALVASPREPALETESLFDLVVEAAPNAMVLVDQQGVVAYVNVQAEKLFGYQRDELLGQSVELLVSDRFRGAHPALRSAFASSPVARPMGAGRDLYARRKDGSDIPVEIGINPVKTREGDFVLAAIVDLTERKRAEEQRFVHAGIQRRAQEVEELNRQLADASRFKSQFVATMSHELRTPLNAIIGATELLSGTQLDDRQQINVETVNEAAEALLALINSILDFSKIEAGKMDLQTKTFEVESVLEGAADVVAQLARKKGIALHTYVDPLIVPLRGDADRLRQILLNLLGNAVKFTHHGHVVARALPVETHAADVTLRFEVEDTGIGVPSDLLPHLFEPFVQAESCTFGGTGLGLSICKRLVELMGGEIGVRSRPGAGTLFWFTAKFGRAGPAEPRKTLDGIAGLIVSGDDVFAQIVARYMNSWSMESRRAQSGVDVVKALRPGVRPQWVAIVDLDDLGGATIAETIEIVRNLLPARVIPIGGEGPLHKPLRQSNLFDAIVHVSDLKPSARPASPQPAAQAEPVTFEPDGRILVAEDNTRLQRLLKLQFEELGVPVTLVSDGRAAVESLRRDRFSMVFMDCQMPELDGLSATRLIRDEERQRGERVPIVAMTANAFPEDREACIQAGMDDYLAKPVRRAQLRDAIERWSRRDERNLRQTS